MTSLFHDEPIPQNGHHKPGFAYRYLVEKQTLLARARGLTLVGSAGDRGEQRYHLVVGTNVHGWDGHALADYRRGQGNEADGKIKACHSSSALACSLFNVFRFRPEPILKALGLPASPQPSVCLERILPVLPEARGFGGCPNYDAFFDYPGDRGLVAAVEVKYSEWASPRPHPPLKPKYLNTASLWDDLPRLKVVAREVTESDPWAYLDAPQLIRHLLGLHLTGRPYRLYYAWVDCGGEEACIHRREVEEFRSRLDDPSAFVPATVQEIILRVAAADYPGNASWINWMVSRYL